MQALFYIFLHFSDLTGLHCKLIHDLIQFCHNIVQAFDRSMDIFHLHALWFQVSHHKASDSVLHEGQLDFLVIPVYLDIVLP